MSHLEEMIRSQVQENIKKRIPEDVAKQIQDRINTYVPEKVRKYIPIANLSYPQEVGETANAQGLPEVSDPSTLPTVDSTVPVQTSRVEDSTATPVADPVAPVGQPVVSAASTIEEILVPVVEPVTPTSPVAPVGPVAPVEVSPYNNMTHSEILANPVSTVEECNLFCFDECLKLKQFVPFPVIKQCIQNGCHCVTDTGVESKLQEYLSLSSMDALDSVNASIAKPSFFTQLMLTLFVLAIMGGAAYILFKYISERESLKTDYLKDDLQYTQENGYEPMFDQTLSSHL